MPDHVFGPIECSMLTNEILMRQKAVADERAWREHG
jgi:hypothetical protein